MKFISKQQNGVTKLDAVFYKSKMTFLFAKTLSPPELHENPHGGGAGEGAGGEAKKEKQKLI